MTIAVCALVSLLAVVWGGRRIRARALPARPSLAQLDTLLRELETRGSMPRQELAAVRGGTPRQHVWCAPGGEEVFLN